MIYIIYVKAGFSSAAKRDNALSQVTAYIAQPQIANDMFVPAQVAPYDKPNAGYANALTAMLRFRTQTSRDNLWTTLDTYLNQPNATPTLSFGETWDQMLDAPNPDADTNRYNYVTKTWT